MVLVSSSVPAFAATESPQGKANPISPSTVITAENIYDVLQYVGIDSKYFTKSETVSSDLVTVKELQEAIAQVESENSKSATYKSFVTPSNPPVINSIPPEPVTLTNEIDHSSYYLDYTVTGSYNPSNGTFVGASNPKVSLWEPHLQTHHKIDSKSIHASVVSNYSAIELDANLVIGIYYSLPVGEVEIGSEDVNDTSYWYASDI